MPRQEYHPVQGAYVDTTAPPDPFLEQLRADLAASLHQAIKTKEINHMATKTQTTTPNPTLPATVPAGILSRKAAPAPTTASKNVHNFAAWKDAIGTAQSATGYDTTSPIYGHTDIEVLTTIKPFLADIIALAGSEIKAGTYTLRNGTTVDSAVLWNDANEALNAIDELLKRKVAKQIAGQTYKSRKTI